MLERQIFVKWHTIMSKYIIQDATKHLQTTIMLKTKVDPIKIKSKVALIQSYYDFDTLTQFSSYTYFLAPFLNIFGELSSTFF